VDPAAWTAAFEEAMRPAPCPIDVQVDGEFVVLKTLRGPDMANRTVRMHMESTSPAVAARNMKLEIDRLVP
jgi:hypothetical protein